MENNKEKKGPSFDPVKFLRLCLKDWWVFAICVFICLFLAGIYLLIRKPNVEVDAQLMLPPETSSGGISMLSDLASSFNVSDMFGGSSTENEIAVIRSYSVFLKTATDLGLNTGYYEKAGFMKWLPAYEKTQLQLTTLPSINDTIKGMIQFDLKLRSNGNFDIKAKRKRQTIVDVKDQTLPVTLETIYGPFTIDKTENYGKVPCENFRIRFCSYSASAQSYLKLVNVYAPNKKTDFIALSFITTSADFGKKLLNTIIDNYNLTGNSQRFDRDNNTMDFLSGRLEQISGQLANSESELIQFKKANHLTDVEFDAADLLTKNSEFDSRLFYAQTRLEILEMTLQFLNDPDNNYSLLPAVSDGAEANEAISAYNALIIERMKLLNSAKSNSKAVQLMDQQIDAMRGSIKSTIQGTYKNVKVSVDNMKKEQKKMKGMVETMPAKEVEYVNLERNTMLNQQLYLFLLKQREETAMSLAKVTPTLITIDAPYTLTDPPGLSNAMVLALAILFGGLLGLLWILYMKMPHAALGNLGSLKSIITPPIISEVKKDKHGTALPVTTPGMGQSVRMLRSELEFIMKDFKRKAIVVTSVDQDADASYVSANLAAAFAMQGAKTLLVDANLREPAIGSTFGVKKSGEVVETNVGGSPLWVFTPEHEATDPADMLASCSFSDLIGSYKAAYSYVIINGPALKNYSDTYSLAALADLTIVNIDLHSDTPDDVDLVNSLTSTGRLPRIAIVAINNS